MEAPKQFDYTHLDESDDALAAYGFESGQYQYDGLKHDGKLKGPEPEGPIGLHARVWDVTDLLAEDDPNESDLTESVIDDPGYSELGTRTYGVDGERYADNTQGKLETAVQFQMSSIDAQWAHGEEIKQIVLSGAHPSRSWTGAVIVIGRVERKDGTWLFRAFAISCSGAQGHIDQLIAATIGYAATLDPGDEIPDEVLRTDNAIIHTAFTAVFYLPARR